MSTAFDKAWATAEERPAQSGMSQDELITEFARLDALVKEHGARRREIGAALAGIALANKRTQNTVRLESTDGQRLKVEFGIEYSYDTEMMKDVLELLGTQRFDELFKTEIVFTARLKTLKAFLNTVSSDETVQTAKQIIQDATHEKEKTPYVSVA